MTKADRGIFKLIKSPSLFSTEFPLYQEGKIKMNFLIHGDYHLNSRQFLVNLIIQAKETNKEIFNIDGEKADLNEIIQATTSNSLFGNEKTIVIENLFSRRVSNDQKEILEFFKNYDNSNDLIFWEKKSVGKVLQRKLPKDTQTKEFKTPVLIFKLVELISPQTKKQALELLSQILITEAAEFVFVMIARQIRMMILLASGEQIGGAPWMIGKMKKQASNFEIRKLIKLYEELYEIDRDIKTGKTIMPLAWHLQIWMSWV